MNVEVGFDEFGNLIPYQVIALSWEDAEKLLATSAYKRTLWKQLLKYDSDLFEILQKNWTQWLGGSFLTTKDRPNDIDVVNFVEWSENLGKQERLLGDYFMADNSKELYNIDAYFTVVYSPDDERFKSTLERTNYWLKWLGKDKNNGTKKGIVELIIEML